MNIYILRGIPGSGKSTWIKQENRATDDEVCSADFYHTINGVYKFDPKRTGEAHNLCLSKFLQLLQTKRDHIYVDNTNTTAWEIAPYYRLAEVFLCNVQIITILCPVEVAIARNVHAVPGTTILTMHRNILMEQLPPHWKHTVIAAEGF